MRSTRFALPSLVLGLALCASTPVWTQTQAGNSWAVSAPNDYRIVPNVVYGTAGGHELKMDVYVRREVGPRPTLMFMHGGFWATGSKEASFLSLLPWFEMGWNVVNVEYRLARVAQAPAAVEDCLCALRFVAVQAQAYNVDVSNIVVSGESAGGHLALALGMFPEDTRLDGQCAGAPLPRVAAVVNWFGVTDVADVVEGPNRSTLAASWMGSRPDWQDVSRRLSPLTYVRAGLPPILTIHGDADTIVPYAQGERLHEALTKAGSPNQLLTIPGGRHGGFTVEQRTRIYQTIREFLTKHKVGM